MARRGASGEGVASRRTLLWVAGLALAAIALPAGWWASDVLERDNDFCNACHLDGLAATLRGEGVPLHIDIRHDFDGQPPASLAGLHGGARVEGRPSDPAFRCIDCHGGVGPAGRARVKLLAAKDAFWFVVGHFEEPDGMRWPLLDDDCRQCHDAFREKGDGLGGPAFHDLAVHNNRLGVGCVECHASHDTGGNPDAWFLHAAPVRRQCVRCHPEFEAFQEETG